MSIGKENVGKGSGGRSSEMEDASRDQEVHTGTAGKPGKAPEKTKPYDPDRSDDPGKSDVTRDPTDDADEDDGSQQGDGATVTPGGKPLP